jgi:hypothetical protein
MSNEPVPTRADRRQFLAGVGTAAVGAGFAMLSSAALARPMRHSAVIVGDVAVMQGALGLEHEGIAAYRIAAGSGLLSPGTIAVASVFLGHHEGHRDALAKLIVEAGAKPVEPKSDQDYVSALNLGLLKSEGDVIKLATSLEQGAANAYVGQIATLRDAKLARLFSQLAADEAVHWALLNSAAGGSVSKAPFLFG